MEKEISIEQYVELYKNFGRANKQLGIHFLAMVLFMTTNEETKKSWLFSSVKKMYELALRHNMPDKHVEEIYCCLAIKAASLDELLYTLSEFNYPSRALIKPNLQERIRRACGDSYMLANASRKYLLEAREEGYAEFVRSYAMELIKAESFKKE